MQGSKLSVKEPTLGLRMGGNNDLREATLVLILYERAALM